jgi:DNA-binding NarL/FixJ family response regulator
MWILSFSSNGIIHRTMNQIRVVLADDHAVVRAGIRNAIEELNSLTVVGEAKDGPTLISALEEYGPSLLLIDVTMPEFDPISTIQQIKIQYPNMKILVISAYDDDIYVQGLLKIGVDGYHLNDQPLKDLRLAVERVLAGEKWISSTLVDKLLSYQEKNLSAPPLTPRQREILNLLQTSHSNQTIALKLNLSVKTIENHLTRLYRILGVQSRLEAVNYIRENSHLLLYGQNQPLQHDSGENGSHKTSVLVVDDNPRFRNQLRRMIGNSYNGTTHEADCIDEAVKIVESSGIELAFVDVLLGDQNGLDCAKQLKKISPATCIVVISAYPDKEFHRQSIKAGAVAFIDKKELDSATIRQIIEDVSAKITRPGIS